KSLIGGVYKGADRHWNVYYIDEEGRKQLLWDENNGAFYIDEMKMSESGTVLVSLRDARGKDFKNVCYRNKNGESKLIFTDKDRIVEIVSMEVHQDNSVIIVVKQAINQDDIENTKQNIYYIDKNGKEGFLFDDKNADITEVDFIRSSKSRVVLVSAKYGTQQEEKWNIHYIRSQDKRMKLFEDEVDEIVWYGFDLDSRSFIIYYRLKNNYYKQILRIKREALPIDEQIDSLRIQIGLLKTERAELDKKLEKEKKKASAENNPNKVDLKEEKDKGDINDWEKILFYFFRYRTYRLSLGGRYTNLVYTFLIMNSSFGAKFAKEYNLDIPTSADDEKIYNFTYTLYVKFWLYKLFPEVDPDEFGFNVFSGYEEQIVKAIEGSMSNLDLNYYLSLLTEEQRVMTGLGNNYDPQEHKSQVDMKNAILEKANDTEDELARIEKDMDPDEINEIHELVDKLLEKDNVDDTIDSADINSGIIELQQKIKEVDREIKELFIQLPQASQKEDLLDEFKGLWVK
ncbi:MAG: hypothetical protein KAI91_06020, partial [Candidatus Omnitrophica bacterium]|nr:hypothetical protein [Candidatus Omnitrophota bacterium]